MRRFLWLLLSLFFAVTLHAQQDIILPTTYNTQFIIGRNLTANASGPGGFNNNFIVRFPSGWPYMCVQLYSPNSPIDYTLNAYSAIDPSTNVFTGNSYAWTQLTVLGDNPVMFTSAGGGGWQIQTLAPSDNLIQLNATGKVVLSFSQVQTTSTTPITILGSLNSTGSCGRVNFNYPAFAYAILGVNANTTYSLIGPPGYPFVDQTNSYKACQITVQAQNTGGTSPTENVYIDSLSNLSGQGNDDRIAFAQFTTGTTTRTIDFTPSGNTSDHVPTQGTLTAGAIQPGLFEKGIYVNIKVGGTSPVYNDFITVTCQR
jgi:hypothetical protein